MNNLLLFWAPGMPEMIIILVIVLVLFGANRLPQLAKGMGESIRNFKTGMSEAEAEDEKKHKAKAEDEKKDKAKAV
jgi:sec-independent protein translocase protein TatA